MDAKEFLDKQPKVYRLSWVERLLKEFSELKCKEQKEIDSEIQIPIVKKSTLKERIKNAPLATDK